MNQFDANAQFRSCQKLLSAVVALAVQDAQITPIIMGRDRRPKRPTNFAITAMKFLFTNDSDGYLVALDIDPEQFRKRLINQMYKKDDPDITTYRNKKAFRFNYEYFYNNLSSFNYEMLYKDRGGF